MVCFWCGAISFADVPLHGIANDRACQVQSAQLYDLFDVYDLSQTTCVCGYFSANLCLRSLAASHSCQLSRSRRFGLFDVYDLSQTTCVCGYFPANLCLRSLAARRSRQLHRSRRFGWHLLGVVCFCPTCPTGPPPPGSLFFLTIAFKSKKVKGKIQEKFKIILRENTISCAICA